MRRLIGLLIIIVLIFIPGFIAGITTNDWINVVRGYGLLAGAFLSVFIISSMAVLACHLMMKKE